MSLIYYIGVFFSLFLYTDFKEQQDIVYFDLCDDLKTNLSKQ